MTFHVRLVSPPDHFAPMPSTPPSFYILLIIAGLIGAVSILTNSQILVVGAMVVGPGYGRSRR
jgi:hypothetical protein